MKKIVILIGLVFISNFICLGQSKLDKTLYDTWYVKIGKTLKVDVFNQNHTIELRLDSIKYFFYVQKEDNIFDEQLNSKTKNKVVWYKTQKTPINNKAYFSTAYFSTIDNMSEKTNYVLKGGESNVTIRKTFDESINDNNIEKYFEISIDAEKLMYVKREE